jgi:DNA-binding IclR family transcriptional regulator
MRIPRTSLHRIMQVLVDKGIVVRDVEHKFRGRMRLVPRTDTGDFDLRLQAEMAALAEGTGQTAEWFRPSADGMVLVARVLPGESEIGVRAQVGFLRPWRGELDAVLALGTQWLQTREQRPSLEAYTGYQEPFELSPLPSAVARERLALARRHEWLIDEVPNTNNVRRAAALVRHNGQPLGVLCVAEVVHPNVPERIHELGQQVRAAAEKI